MELFADTSYWIALLNPLDALHKKATALSARHAMAQIVTTEMVLTEFANSFSEGGPHLRQAVATAIDLLRASRTVRVEPQTSQQFTSALQQYRRASDKGWSLTDCASFSLMENRGLQAALTHNHHFAQAGYIALLR